MKLIYIKKGLLNNFCLLKRKGKEKENIHFKLFFSNYKAFIKCLYKIGTYVIYVIDFLGI